MVSDREHEEAEERATSLKTIVDSLLPEGDLPPWNTITDKREAFVFASMNTIANLQDHLVEVIKADEAGEKVEYEHGGVEMVSFFNRDLARNLGNYSPSKGGVGRKQVSNIAQSQRSGVAVEPEKRSLLEKATGRGKQKDMV